VHHKPHTPPKTGVQRGADMNPPSAASSADNGPAYPRYVRIAGQWVSSFKLFLCLGLCLGIFVVAGLAQSSGFPPLPVGLGALALAIIALAGARLYHLLVYRARYFGKNARHNVWNSNDGGWSVFGAFLAMAPCSFAVARLLDIPADVFWDFLAGGILAGGFWARLGCVFNGCCGGRETRGWCGLWLHDTSGQRRQRIPVQFLEMAWVLIGAIGFVWLWPKAFPPGNYALGVLAWYGLGRFFLEPLREAPDLVAGRVRINQCIAAALALGAGGALLARAFAS
jgi:phosphatidylglycerol---prolipoprotein diacylglyceryl transferase